MYYETLDKQCHKFISILEENIDKYQNSEDIITKENGQIKVYAPYGLSDIFQERLDLLSTKVISKNYIIKR